MTLNHRAVQHFVRRGLDFAPGAREQLAQHFAENNGPTKLTTTETVILLLIPLCFYISYILTQYTLFEVLPGLVNIEQPTTVVVSDVNTDAEPDSPLEKAPLLDEEVVVIRQEPITSNIRAALVYLKSIGGTRAHYRGFWISTFYHMVHAIVMHGFMVLAAIMPLAQPFMTFVCHMAATVLLCRLHMTWTHIVVSPPSPLPWYKRVVRGSHAFRSLVLPSLKVAVAHQLVIILPAIAFFTWGPIPEGEALRNDIICRGLLVVTVAALVAFFVLLPASVHLTRVEASLLPEDVDTIVAFDRTLGGRVSAETKWSVRYFAVMASFTAGDRVRIAKYYVKASCILLMIVALAISCVALQINNFGIDRVQETIMDLVRQTEQHGQVVHAMKF